MAAPEKANNENMKDLKRLKNRNEVKQQEAIAAEAVEVMDVSLIQGGAIGRMMMMANRGKRIRTRKSRKDYARSG